MTLDEFQKFVRAARCISSARLEEAQFGLGAETGEVLEIFQKAARNNTNIDKTALCLELGDVVHYVIAIADAAGITFDKILHNNYTKCVNRWPQILQQLQEDHDALR